MENTMLKTVFAAVLAMAAVCHNPACAQLQQSDAELAKSLGGNENGMRSYVLVLLKTGPNKMPAGEARDAMFKGHFANIGRLAGEKKLVMAGPLDGVNDLRGLFVFATDDIEEAKKLVATDPVIVNGEMVGEFHKFFASAGLMAITDIHNRIRKK
jgi:uncharacterized protein YciI